MHTNTPTLVFDFDSTFVRSESLEVLAARALENNPEREKILKKIEEITARGMEGSTPFSESLSQRLALFRAHRSAVEETIKTLKGDVTSSITHNRNFFTEHAQNIYIISSGFTEIIVPVVAPYSISADHVFANTFLYDRDEYITGSDPDVLTAQDHGKARQIQALSLPKPIYVIGDGYTDYEMKRMGSADHFIAFTENISREKVTAVADIVCNSFDEVLNYINLNKKTSSQ